MLIRSPEGIGKTSCAFGEIESEMVEAAGDRPSFACFAFRSVEQAEVKAEEYRQARTCGEAVVLRSFWSLYEAECKHAGVHALR
jgi:hypothetical protein